MEISASLVKELRERTGMGIMECKKALSENSGSIDQAINWLRERGLARSQAKAGRITAEGAVFVVATPDQKSAVLVEVNCETDFVGKGDEFQGFVKELGNLILQKKPKTNEELSALSLSNGKKVSDRVTELVQKIGENIQIRRFKTLQAETGIISTYLHSNGRIASAVILENASSANAELAKDLSMHVAASAPRYLSPKEVTAEDIEFEKNLARKKLIEEKKPENLIEKILEGSMKKFFAEICLLEQPFVKDQSLTVEKLVAQANGPVLKSFARFALGEGIEKKKEDFAEEVAKAAKL